MVDHCSRDSVKGGSNTPSWMRSRPTSTSANCRPWQRAVSLYTELGTAEAATVAELLRAAAST